MNNPHEINGSLRKLLDGDSDARAYFDSLHPSVRSKLTSENIRTPEDMAARANEAMRDVLMEYDDIYDDSDSWPNGPDEM